MFLTLLRLDDVPPPARLPAPETGVAAGFPSPAQDYFHGSIDLNKHLILDPTSTFIIRVAGDSMTGVGIFDGDELIVDRSLTAVDGSVVIAVIDGEFTVKRLLIGSRGIILGAENPKYENIVVDELSDLVIWGVATRVLHKL